MNSKVIKQGQSFLDKTTQLTGSIENALKMAIANNNGVTDVLEVGVELKSTAITNKRIASFFSEYNEPATALSQAIIDDIENIGIGSMVIEDTFIVQ